MHTTRTRKHTHAHTHTYTHTHTVVYQGNRTEEKAFKKRKVFKERSERCDRSLSGGLKIPDSKTEQYKNSFFVRTVADWNKPEDTVVTVDSVTAFSSAVGRVLQGLPPTHRQSEQKCVLASF